MVLSEYERTTTRSLANKFDDAARSGEARIRCCGLFIIVLCGEFGIALEETQRRIATALRDLEKIDEGLQSATKQAMAHVQTIAYDWIYQYFPCRTGLLRDNTRVTWETYDHYTSLTGSIHTPPGEAWDPGEAPTISDGMLRIGGSIPSVAKRVLGRIRTSIPLHLVPYAHSVENMPFTWWKNPEHVNWTNPQTQTHYARQFRVFMSEEFTRAFRSAFQSSCQQLEEIQVNEVPISYGVTTTWW